MKNIQQVGLQKILIHTEKRILYDLNFIVIETAYYNYNII